MMAFPPLNGHLGPEDTVPLLPGPLAVEVLRALGHRYDHPDEGPEVTAAGLGMHPIAFVPVVQTLLLFEYVETEASDGSSHNDDFAGLQITEAGLIALAALE